MVEILDVLPDENEFRDQAAAILDTQRPGKEGFDREERIRSVAECLRQIEVLRRRQATVIIRQPDNVD